MKDKIIELLGCGLSNVQVAQTVGCDESYISQLLADETVVMQVQALRSEKASGYVQHDGNIDSLEMQALARVAETIPFMKPMEALKAFDTLNSARRKTGLNHGIPQAPSQIVTISLPANAEVSFKLSADNQVIEVEGRSVATLPSSAVSALLRKQQAQKLLEKVAAGTLVGLPRAVPMIPEVVSDANRKRKQAIEDLI